MAKENMVAKPKTKKREIEVGQYDKVYRAKGVYKDKPFDVVKLETSCFVDNKPVKVRIPLTSDIINAFNELVSVDL